MKQLFFIIILIGISITSAFAQHPEPFITDPNFYAIQRSVGRVQRAFKVSCRDYPKNYILPKMLTETEGVSVANFLIQSPSDFNLRRDAMNIIPTQTGTIFIHYMPLSKKWEIGYQLLRNLRDQNYLFAESRVFWLSY